MTKQSRSVRRISSRWTKKNRLRRAGFFFAASDYFFSSVFDSLGEVGEAELDEAAPPAGAVLLAPVLLELLDASAPGAGVGDGVVVEVLLLVLGDDAGGVVTVFSSFLLQADRPTTTRAAIRSERFMFFSSRKSSHGL